MLRVPLRSNLTRASSGTVAADGTLTVPVNVGGRAAQVRQVSTEMVTAPAGALCSLRLNGAQVTAMLASGDVAVEPPAVQVSPGDDLVVAWEGCTPGDRGAVLAIYDETAT